MPYDLIANCDYIKSHEVFLVHVDMSEFLLDYYPHRLAVAPHTTRERDEKLKQLMASFAIHLTARTAFESHGWTVHLVSHEPFALYVTGSTGHLDPDGIARGYLVGNVLTEHIRYSDINAIHAQVSRHGKTAQSYVPCDSEDIPAMVEKFYTQSEQQPVRIKISSTSDTAIGLVALSGSDLSWFSDVDLEQLMATKGDFDITPMRSCRFAFDCGCSLEKLLPHFLDLSPKEVDDLYGEDEEIIITCPRCGRLFSIHRENLAEEREKRGSNG